MASPNPRANDPTITLYEFSLSHYNEKARWALDYKGIPYRSRPVLPGFHQGILRRLSGQTRTPVLQIDDEVIAGSAEIVARVDALSSDRPLFPEAPDARVEAEEWVRWLDKEVGPDVRLALFHELLKSPAFASTFFSQAVSSAKQTLYRWAFPAVSQVIKKKLNVNAANADQAREVVDRALTRVARSASATGYLVGEEFSVADLTAGALFFPLFYPQELPSSVPDRNVPEFKNWLDIWRNHEGAGYVRTLFSRHR